MALGVFIGITPFWGVHLALAVLLASALRLNRIVVYAAANVANPVTVAPIVFAEVQVGHRLLEGAWLPLRIAEVKGLGFGELLWVFVVGSLLVGAAAAVVAWAVVYPAVRIGRRSESWIEVADRVSLRYLDASVRDAEASRSSLLRDPIYPFLLAEEPFPRASRILDLGCGRGVLATLCAAAALAADAPEPVPEPDAKALAYYRSGNVLWWLGQAFGLAFPLLLLATGFSARLRDAAQRIAPHWLGTAALYAVFYRALDWAASRPLGYYGGFVRPHAYGLSNQTFAKWLRDSSLDLAVSALVGAVVAMGLYAWLRKAPRRWWLGATACLVPFLLLVFLIQPLWIAPLYNDFGPMQDPALEAKILALAERSGIEGSRVFEVAKSVDTRTLNAYVTGFLASKRIVLWDTLLAKLDEPEVLFVMGHEMGHYVLDHVLWGIVLSAFGAGFGLYAINGLAPRLIARFGALS